MKEKYKKMTSVLIIIVLLPYILTVFIKGEGILVVQSTLINTQVQVKLDGEVKSVTWEEYLIGILAKEIPQEYSLEAMKAQAVIIRTRLALYSGGIEDYIYEEDYYTIEEIQQKWPENTSVEMYKLLMTAIEETEGMLMYYEGELIISSYHALNTGLTRNGNEVLYSEGYEYLVSVSCPLDAEVADVTMFTITYEDLLESLDMEITGMDNIDSIVYEDIQIIDVDEAGYVLALEILGNSISGETLRSVLSLKSSAFTLQEMENGIQITTYGNGHGLGLSQNTAHYMGLEGKSYIEILEYFYIGAEVVETS